MANHSVFKLYFDLLDETLRKHGLKDKPSQIYNCDQSGILLEHKLPKIATRGMKKVRQCTSDTKTQITILACASAAGQTIPPMVLFAGKNHNNAFSKGEVPETLYGMSQSDGSRAVFKVVFKAISSGCCSNQSTIIATRWILFTLHSRVGKVS